MRIEAAEKGSSVLIHLYWRRNIREISRLLLIKQVTGQHWMKCSVDDVALAQGINEEMNNNSDETVPLKALLPSGEPYVLYRFLILIDEFSVSRNLRDPKSSGGVYLLPVSLPPNVSRTIRRIRTICMTHTSIGTNEALVPMLNDIKTGNPEGFMGHTPTSTPVRSFFWNVWHS